MTGWVVAGALAALFIVVLAFVYARRHGIQRLRGERVVLQTRDDRSLRGVLVASYADCVVIGHFQYLGEANPVDLPGEATVLRENLSWIHKLGPGD